MKKEDIEKYIKLLKLDPEAKYMLIVSIDSGIEANDLVGLKLSDQFLDEMLLIHGNPHELIEHIQITKKNV